MWRNQRRWLAPGECYALCLVVWNQGSRAKRASEIQPKIPGDVFFENEAAMITYIYIYTNMYITGDKKNVIYCAPNCWETTLSYTVISSRSNTWSPWQKWRLGLVRLETDDDPKRSCQVPAESTLQRNPKNPQKTMCGKWPWPCAVSSPQQKNQKRSSPFEASQACRNVSEFLA